MIFFCEIDQCPQQKTLISEQIPFSFHFIFITFFIWLLEFHENAHKYLISRWSSSFSRCCTRMWTHCNNNNNNNNMYFAAITLQWWCVRLSTSKIIIQLYRNGRMAHCSATAQNRIDTNYCSIKSYVFELHVSNNESVVDLSWSESIEWLTITEQRSIWCQIFDTAFLKICWHSG